MSKISYSKVGYTGFIAGVLCKGVRRDNRPSVAVSRGDKSDCAGLFDFVMSHYADEVIRMRRGDV